MDKRVTVRFYDVERFNPNGPRLQSVLEEIINSRGPQAREMTLSGNVTIRLERLETGNDYVTGEFTRVQNTNYPSEVHADGVDALPVDGRLGHGIAFRFRPSDSVLAVQYDPRIISPSRINSYILATQSDAAFLFRPRMNEDSWKRFAQHPVRKITIGIASPADLANIEDAGASVGEAIRNMGEAYEAPSITVELGMGRRNGSLSEATKDMMLQLFNMFRDDKLDLRKLRGVVETEDGIPNDEINLLDEVLSKKEEIELPDNDPDVSYKTRRDWLRTQLSSHA